MAGWFDVAGGPTPFLRLGPCSRDWLDHALTALLNAENPPHWQAMISCVRTSEATTCNIPSRRPQLKPSTGDLR